MSYPFQNLQNLSKKTTTGKEHILQFSIDPAKTINLRRARLVFNVKIGKGASPTDFDFSSDVVAFKQNLYAFYDHIIAYSGNVNEPIFQENYRYLTYDIMSKIKDSPEAEWARDNSYPDYICPAGMNCYWGDKREKRRGLIAKRELMLEKFGSTSWSAGAEFSLPFPVDNLVEMNKQVNYGNFYLYLRIGDAKNCIFFPGSDGNVSVKIENIKLEVPTVLADPRESKWLLSSERHLPWTGFDNVQLIELNPNQKYQKMDPIILESVPKYMAFCLLRGEELQNELINKPRYMAGSDKIETIQSIQAVAPDSFTVTLPADSVLCDSRYNNSKFTIKGVKHKYPEFCELSPSPNITSLSRTAQTSNTMTFTLTGAQAGWGKCGIDATIVSGTTDGTEMTLTFSKPLTLAEDTKVIIVSLVNETDPQTHSGFALVKTAVTNSTTVTFDNVSFVDDLDNLDVLKEGVAAQLGSDSFSTLQYDYGEATIEVADENKNYLDYVRVDVSQEVSDATGQKVRKEHMFTTQIGKKDKHLDLHRGNWETPYEEFKKIGGYSRDLTDASPAYGLSQFKEEPIWIVPMSASNKIPVRELKPRTSEHKKIEIDLEFLNSIHSDDDIRILLMFSYKGEVFLKGKEKMQTAETIYL